LSQKEETGNVPGIRVLNGDNGLVTQTHKPLNGKTSLRVRRISPKLHRLSQRLTLDEVTLPEIEAEETGEEEEVGEEIEVEHT